jgi:hypothetical protein
MYKSICVAAVLLAAFAFMSGSQPAGASAPISYTSPQIVARGKLLNQTAPIPTTTILTPSQSGLYRLSVYATMMTGSSSSWSFTPNWTDDSSASLTTNGVLMSQNTAGPFLEPGADFSLGAPIILEAKGGTAITYSVTQSGPPDGSVYSMYYTLERLE